MSFNVNQGQFSPCPETVRRVLAGRKYAVWVWCTRNREVVKVRERSEDSVKAVDAQENPAQSEGLESVTEVPPQHWEITENSRLRVDDCEGFDVWKDCVVKLEVQRPSLHGGISQREGMNAVYDDRVLEQSQAGTPRQELLSGHERAVSASPYPPVRGFHPARSDERASGEVGTVDVFDDFVDELLSEFLHYRRSFRLGIVALAVRPDVCLGSDSIGR